MIARGFKPVGWVAAVGTAALGCYMLSLNVAAERAELAKVERQIILAKRDIRALQTELGTRGRLQQLEHWNANVLALSAPASGQFLDNAFTLARYSEPEKSFEERAKVRLASAQPLDVEPAKPAVQRGFDDAPSDLNKPLVRQASLIVGEATQFKPVNSVAAPAPPAKPLPAAPKTTMVKAEAAKPKPKAKTAPAKPPVKSASLIDSSLAREIVEAARAETMSGSAAGR